MTTFRPHLHIKPMVPLIAGALLIILLVYYVDPSRLFVQAGRIPLLAFVQFGASVLVFHILRSIRWRSLLRGMEADPSFGTVFWTNMIGYGVNAFIPVRFGGEVARAYVIESKARLGFFPSLSSIAVERILDLLAIVGLATLGAMSYSSSTNRGSFVLILMSTGTVTLAMLAVVLIGSRNLPAVMRFFRWILSKIPMRNSWRGRLLTVVESTLVGVASIGRDGVLGQPALEREVLDERGDQRTPDLGSIVQEIVARPGWVRGNALAILITGTGRRTAEAYEGLNGHPPSMAPIFT